MTIKFDTLQDALAAGYRKPRRGGPDADEDTSGFNCYGYDFREPGTGRESVTVYLSEARNRVPGTGPHTIGAYAALFAPSEMDKHCTEEEAAVIAVELGVRLERRTSRRRGSYLVLKSETLIEDVRLRTVGGFRTQCLGFPERASW